MIPVQNPRKILALAVSVWLCATAPSFGADPAAADSPRGMVVSPEAHASRVGAEVLAEGGTAADAAVAVAFALAVTNPQAGGIGGGGFLLYRDEHGNHTALDFRETAPEGLTPDRFVDESGKPVPGLSLETGLAVGVPGVVAGLAEIHERWGVLPWKRLIEPAIGLARDGFPVYPDLVRAYGSAEKRLRLDERATAIFLPGAGVPLRGRILEQPQLAATLERIARRGRAGFYEGPVAQALVATVQARGGVMELTDLGAYEVVEREPVRGTYRGYRVVSFPPPSSGGIILLQMLAMLERFEMPEGYGASDTIHLMAEIQRRAFADRSKWLGDPDHVDVPVERLLDSAYVASRASTIDRSRATPSSEILPGAPAAEGSDTAHFSVADRSGRAASLTTTLNTSFGSGIVAAGTGIVLNNEMDDFSLAPGVPNVYGLVGGEANAVRPRKRPLSSMTPTIVEYAETGKRPFLVLGSPGGPRIINAVFQVLVNVIDHGMELQEAVNAPRVHHQWIPDLISYEERALPADVRRALRAMGHSLATYERIGNVNAIGADENGHWLGAADPRKGGAATGQP
ncbi:MAG: gamma-glutamyltransferase [Acidobacteria bacterium]|nr:gamma-glutamyltransferase [Acidobacteriota bacterium]NIM63961.1 gamma-glutamyltransferase [Acidobacteriota bacterium]NIO59366.1 gamma-glutamyltransferase [Acidobacteriota bacterium]NIQ30402.1 gamma-glutamyltransferase [Acidobacteriota bacterium]NIQ85328.1 gamma-glutamyltransferase [Acidobacteriota bacterium]